MSEFVETWRCTECGVIRDPGRRRCGACGNFIGAELVYEPPPDEPPPVDARAGDR